MRIRSTLLALVASAALIALPMAAVAAGLVGDCVDCHTMHNSQNGQGVALVGTSTTGDLATPIQNLLKMDCINCHASPDATSAILTLDNGTFVPQVAHPDTGNDLAGGNFAYSTADDVKGHNVIDITPADGHNEGPYGSPPGLHNTAFYGSLHGGAFSVDAPFDQFTCAGARGCHGTRSQLLSGTTNDNGTPGDTSDDTYENATRRTGLAAVSGAHHNSYDGAKTSTGYPTDAHGATHDGQIVADGYRFIPGLMSYGVEGATDTVRWRNSNASHNEYYGADTPVHINGASGHPDCAQCHVEGYGYDATGANAASGPEGVTGTGLGTRASYNSTMTVPNNSISGFCSTCHADFHSAGEGDSNGTSGAFLRHPSDYVLPGGTTEYAAYDTYNVTAPVARPTVLTAVDTGVTTGTGGDMVMCLSCHKAHASEYDYMLRFEYTDVSTVMTAGSSSSTDGCLACHTTKGAN